MRGYHNIVVYLGLALLACTPGARSGEAARSPSLFDSTQLLEVRLSGPVAATIGDRGGRAERAFVLGAEGVEQNVWVRVRGKSRSRTDVCRFPPLRLRFDNARGPFAGQHTLKLVTHCQNSDKGDANVMEEFLAYRILSLLTPDAFRVRPLHVTYRETEGRFSTRERRRYGFLIESARELESRRGGTFIETVQLSLGQLDPRHAALVYVFQYLIGNTDWSLVTPSGETQCCHNGRLLSIGGSIRYLPYDFDLAGLVNAPYAEPDPRLRLRNVRTRRYRGFCTHRDILRSAIRAIGQREQAIYDLVRTTPGLGEKKEKSAIAYLRRFFDAAGDEEALLADFEQRCLTSSR